MTAICQQLCSCCVSAATCSSLTHRCSSAATAAWWAVKLTASSAADWAVRGVCAYCCQAASMGFDKGTKTCRQHYQRESRLAALLQPAHRTPHCPLTAWVQSISRPVTSEATTTRHTWLPVVNVLCPPPLPGPTHWHSTCGQATPRPVDRLATALKPTCWPAGAHLRPVCCSMPRHFLGAGSLQRCR